MKAFIIGIGLGLALAVMQFAIAGAAKAPTYNLSVDQAEPTGGQVSFTVTRSAPITHPWHAEWVTLDCFENDGTEVYLPSDDKVVIWGTYDSLEGHASAEVTGDYCKAYLTYTPWHPKGSDLNITFAVR